MKNVLKIENAITLVALVITIIVLLILAGITISSLTNSGLFEKVKEAKAKWKNAQNFEEEQLYKYSNEVDDYVSGNRNSGKVTIVKIGDYNSFSDREIDIKELLPNNYRTLRVNNFVLLNARGVVLEGTPVDDENAIINSYDFENGILTLKKSYHRDTHYHFGVNYTLGCILGEIEIKELE